MDEVTQIENKREIKGITAYRLCKSTGTDLSHYYQWRKGIKCSLSRDKVNRIKDYLEIDYEDTITED